MQYSVGVTHQYEKILLIISLGIVYSGWSYGQKVQIPINRQGFHDNIDKEQLNADKLDGKQDGYVKVGDDENMNLQVTSAITKMVDDMQLEIERDTSLDHRLKVKYLSGLHQTLRDYNVKRAYNRIDAEEAPAMLQAYHQMMEADIKGKAYTPLPGS